MSETDLTEVEWQQGDDERELYACATIRHPFIGRLETAELAAYVAGLHNAALARRRATARGVHARDMTGVQIGPNNTQVNHF